MPTFGAIRRLISKTPETWDTAGFVQQVVHTRSELTHWTDMESGQLVWVEDEKAAVVWDGTATPPAWVYAGGALDLGDLADVDLPTTVVADRTIAWNGTSHHWEQAAFVTPAELEATVAGLIAGISHKVEVNDFTQTPPLTPTGSDLYIVAPGATGAWAGKDNTVAAYEDGAWVFVVPEVRDTHYTESDGRTRQWDGTRWNVINATGGAGGGGGGSMPVGTIIESLLTESEFRTAYPADLNKWALADGRSVAGTRYEALTGRSNVPDLRGAYLRMAGQSVANPTWNGGVLGSFLNWLTGRPTTAFTTDSQGNHSHTIAPFAHMGLDSGGATGWSYGVATATVATSTAGAHTHRVTGGGDAETRPTSYTVNYFIRIDD
jgi:hypothetical protein